MLFLSIALRIIISNSTHANIISIILLLIHFVKYLFDCRLTLLESSIKVAYVSYILTHSDNGIDVFFEVDYKELKYMWNIF